MHGQQLILANAKINIFYVASFERTRVVVPAFARRIRLYNKNINLLIHCVSKFPTGLNKIFNIKTKTLCIDK